MEAIETCNYSPRFAVRKSDGLWIRMTSEPPLDKDSIFARKRELKEQSDSAGNTDKFRVIKHKGKHFLYKKR